MKIIKENNTVKEKTYLNKKNGSKYTRRYEKNGVDFMLTNGYENYHDFLNISIEYPDDVIKELDVTSAGCVLPQETEDSLKELFLNISFPIEDDATLAAILFLAVPKGCLLSQCPEINIILGKEYLTENEVGYEHFTWNITDEILYEYGEKVINNLKTLSQNSNNEDKVMASIS